ncbi:MAG: site-specific integrase [Coriobacteriales bacterium]|jgi:integrase|nr:site-specific integrase [Coriobacteriales bacterium]
MSLKNIGRRKWRVIVKLPGQTTAGKKQKYLDRIFAGSQEEAEAYHARLQTAPAEASKMTLGDYLTHRWLPGLTCSPNTISYYTQAIPGCIRDIGCVRLCDLTPGAIEGALNALPEGSVRARGKRTLSAALRTARRWGLTTSNLMELVRVDGTTKQRAPVEAYCTEELNAVLDAFSGDWLEAVVILMAFCGLRKEEALALDWGDIKDGAVAVSKAYVCVGHEPQMRPTKTHEARSAYLSGWALERLEELRGDDGVPVCVCRKKRCHPQTATRHYRYIIEQSGLRYIPLSKLRHTSATIALATGIDVALVSRMLGHSKVSTTVDRYVRPLEAAQEAASALLSDAVRPSAR